MKIGLYLAGGVAAVLFAVLVTGLGGSAQSAQSVVSSL
jgi:hypothetical protein